MVREECAERRGALGREAWQGAVRSLRQEHLSRCNLHPSAFVRTSHGLSDEWDEGSLQDYDLWVVRSRRQFQRQSSLRPTEALCGWQGQAGSRDAIQFRDDERYHRREFGIARRGPAGRHCRTNFRREHSVAGRQLRLRLLPEPRGGGAHGSHDGSAQEAVRSAKTGGRTDGALRSGNSVARDLNRTEEEFSVVRESVYENGVLVGGEHAVLNGAARPRAGIFVEGATEARGANETEAQQRFASQFRSRPAQMGPHAGGQGHRGRQVLHEEGRYRRRDRPFHRRDGGQTWLRGSLPLSGRGLREAG